MMKTRFLLLALPIVLGLSLAFNARAAAPDEVNSQAELDARGEGDDYNRLGHAFDNQEAKLFWHTDLEAAKKAAKRENKPILSLRLLGKLTDEYSCANSRFFRVLLYPQRDINSLLRQKFVLHWSSERPVPVVTIDMGDGRKLKRTLTGNSAHYLLDENGRPLDVLPGLYAPQEFQKWLQNGATLASSWHQSEASTRDELLKSWHRDRLVMIWKERSTDEKWIETQAKNSLERNPLTQTSTPQDFVPAERAMPIAVSKAIIEAPLLDATRLFSGSGRVENWSWGVSGNGRVTLDDPTKQRVLALSRVTGSEGVQWNANAQLRAQKATPPVPNSSPENELVARLERSLAVDTQSNRFEREIPIHALFAEGKVEDFTSLNRLIYDRLFGTPRANQWLGLHDETAFTALSNGGIANGN